MSGLHFVQILCGFTGSGLWWFFLTTAEDVGFWFAAVSTAILLAVAYGLTKIWRPLIRFVRTKLQEERPTPKEIIVAIQRSIQNQKWYLVSFLWVVTWACATMTPLFILIFQDVDVELPPTTLLTILWVAITPLVLLMMSFTCLATWQDWKQCATARAKVLFGLRMAFVLVLTGVIVVFGDVI